MITQADGARLMAAAKKWVEAMDNFHTAVNTRKALDAERSAAIEFADLVSKLTEPE